MAKYTVRQRYDIGVECRVNYGLEYLAYRLSCLPEQERWRPSVIRFQEDFTTFRKKYQEALSQIISDYLTLACFCESRHSSKSGSACRSHYIDGMKYYSMRVYAAVDATQFTKMSILERTHEIFSKGYWASSYGGEKWAKIAELAIEHHIGAINSTIFIDQAFNLQHNGGLCYDKGFLLRTSTRSNILHFLNVKARYDLKRWDVDYRYTTPAIVSLFNRAIVLGILSDIPVNFMIAIDWNCATLENRPYTPIRFGNEIIGPIVERPGYEKKVTEDHSDSGIVVQKPSVKFGIQVSVDSWKPVWSVSSGSNKSETPTYTYHNGSI